ncbi:hypothetical protein QFZ22_009354 [Streptomyces canus]|uniref:Uncharacterized protein n=1 Tax=Streptomyces canus TaxID=58343 RepID=A0AAW8FTV7_9ACTN|nr:hypothetical protein [Streptomyces canus]
MRVRLRALLREDQTLNGPDAFGHRHDWEPDVVFQKQGEERNAQESQKSDRTIDALISRPYLLIDLPNSVRNTGH